MKKLFILSSMLRKLGEANYSDDIEELAREFGGEPISEEEWLSEELSEPIKGFYEGGKDYYGEVKEDVHVDEYRFIDAIFKENGISLVSAGGREAFLGHGAFGKVFRAVWKGKPVAVKVSADKLGRGDEVNVWKKILDVKAGMPDNLSKHIPEIYFLKSGKLNGGFYELIIMEELKPLDENLISKFTGDYLDNKEETIYTDLERVLMQVIRGLKSWGYEYNVGTEDVIKIKDKFYQKENISLLLNIIKSSKDSKEASKKVINELIKIIKDMGYDVAKTKEFYHLMLGYISHSFTGGLSMPMDSGDSLWLDSKMEDFPPETKSLAEALRYLEENKVYWGDLHEYNVMVGGDGNLKIIDVGLYDYE